MKYIIRSIKDGKRIPVPEIEEKKKAAKEKLLNAGLNYLEYEAQLGTLNAQAQRIEEQVIVIEAVMEENYV